VGDFTIPMTWFQSLNPLLIFVLTPLMVAHWLRRARRGRELTSIMKMALGAGITAVAYVMLAAVAAWTQNHGGQVSWLWIAAFFCVMTVGELYILPVGLGLFGRLAPAGFTATSIALWFLAGFAGNLAAGAMGTYWSTLSPAQFFLLIAGIATLSGLLLWGFERPARQATAERYVAKVSFVETDVSQQP
jgi:proton-dependent oligopeptide transporter, POT family